MPLCGQSENSSSIYAVLEDRYQTGSGNKNITFQVTNNPLNKVQLIKLKSSKFTNYICCGL